MEAPKHCSFLYITQKITGIQSSPWNKYSNFELCIRHYAKMNVDVTVSPQLTKLCHVLSLRQSLATFH